MEVRSVLSLPSRKSARSPGAPQLPIRWAVLGAAALVFLAACSSSGGSSTAATGAGASGTSGTSCSSPGITGNQIKVGVLTTLSGPFAVDHAGFLAGARARIALQNADGGVGGRQIDLVAADDGSSVPSATVAAQGLVQSSGVFGIITDTSVGSGAFPFLEQNNVPVVDGLANDPSSATDRNEFSPTGANTSAFGTTTVAKFAKQQGVTNLAVLDINVPDAIINGNAIAAGAKAIGLKVGDIVKDIPIGTFDATSLALRLKALGVNGVTMQTDLLAQESVYGALKQQGVKLRSFSGTQVYSTSAQAAASTIAGAVSVLDYTPPFGSADPAIQRLEGAVKKYEHVSPYLSLLPFGWIGADTMISGLQKAGSCPTQASFIDRLRTDASYDAGGLISPPSSFLPGLLSTGTPASPLCQHFPQLNANGTYTDLGKVCGKYVRIPA
jgi:ABC-type branched-subunit amino acid transport system substrate-binding protein